MRAIAVLIALIFAATFSSASLDASEAFAETGLELSTEFDASLDAKVMEMHAEYSMDTFEDFLEDSEDSESLPYSPKTAAQMAAKLKELTKAASTRSTASSSTKPSTKPTTKPAAQSGSGKSIDFSQKYSVKTQQCFVKAGYNLAIPRGFRSSGKVDTNLALNVRYGVTAGFKHIHTYMFPCPKCSTTGAQQVKQLVDYMKKTFIDDKVKMVWLDIEQSKYWSTSTAKNRAFFESMLKGAASANVPIGIYTSKSQWEPIMGRGNAYTAGSKYPLWYAHYDKVPNFKDFSTSRIGDFGGWTEPHMKQYKGDIKVCSAGVDESYYTL